MVDATESVIALQGVEFSYPGSGFTLRCKSMTIATGEAVALVGPSGCGKTTLLHLIAGIVVPSQGSVRFRQHSMSALPEPARRALRLREIGLVFQELELLEHLSVEENLLLPAVLRSEVTAPRRARVVELLRACGMEPRLARHPRALSQGERQRVATCRALLCEPSLILADEPTGNLDAANARRLVDLLLDDARARGATLLVVTHDRELRSRFDRAIDVEALCR